MFKLIETGLKDIDSQHEQLILCMNDLYNAIQAASIKSMLETALQRLTYYGRSHLAYEEQGMGVFKYPEAAKHIEQHHYFMQKLEEISSKIKSDSPMIATELLVFLRDWLLNHIGKEDVKYVNFLLEHNLQLKK